MTPIHIFVLGEEVDLLTVRQVAREVAAAVGAEGQDLVRVATALSEVGRDVLGAGGGRVVFGVSPPDLLAVELRTFGPGAELLAAGADSGLSAARRMVDSLDVVIEDDGRAVVHLTKQVGQPVSLAGPALAALRQHVSSLVVRDPADELRTQNRELVTALEEVQTRRDELVVVNRELEDTNRSVLALNAEIDDKNGLLREASAAKTSFLRTMSHELRTPGNSVLGLARLLLDADADPLTAEQHEQVTYIQASALDLVRLVNELLDLAKAESGRLEPTIGDVDLAELFTELRGTTMPLVSRPEVRLVVEDPSSVGILRTDRTLLAHALRNLLSNAVKFTEVGQVRMCAARVDGVVRLTVTDTGIGIAPEDQPRIFEEFFQARSPLHSRNKGSGLGLPYARRVVTSLGGRITLVSAPGAGTSFTVDLPPALAIPAPQQIDRVAG